MSYELEAEALFGVDRPRETTLVDTIVAFIYIRLAKQILVKDLENFEKGLVPVKYPDVYLRRLRASLACLSEDLHQTKRFFLENSIRVTETPTDVHESSVLYQYWIGGQTGFTGSSAHVMRKQVKRYVQYYFTERV